MHYTTFGTSEELRDTLEVVLNPQMHSKKKQLLPTQQSMIYNQNESLLVNEYEYPDGISPEPATSPRRLVTGESRQTSGMQDIDKSGTLTHINPSFNSESREDLTTIKSVG